MLFLISIFIAAAAASVNPSCIEQVNALLRLNDESATLSALHLATTHQDTTPTLQARVMFALAKQRMETNGDRAETLGLLQAVAALEPDWADARYHLAKALMREPRQSAEALALLESINPADLRDPTDPLEILLLRGIAALHSGDLAKTKTHMQSVVALHQKGRRNVVLPDDLAFRVILGYVELCRVHIILNETYACLALMRASLDAFPGVNTAPLVNAAGLAMGLAKGLGAATEHFRRAWQAPTWPSHNHEFTERVFGSTLARLHNGGPPQLVHGCNIDRVHASNLSLHEFQDNYVLLNKPVLISGLMDQWPAQHKWTHEGLSRYYATEPVQIRRSEDIAYSEQFGGHSTVNSTLATFLRAHMADGSSSYIFHHVPAGALIRKDFTLLESIFRAEDFSWSLEKRSEKALFYLGPAGSGASFHEHSAAFNALVHGEKKWILYQPFDYFGPVNVAMPEWFKVWHPRLQNAGKHAYECTQTSGEVLFVPSNFIHGVLNTRPSVGVAVEVGFAKNLLESMLKAEE